jgi:hypothetical protein
MIAFFKEGEPSVGVYLTSPELSLAEELKIAARGVLFFGFADPQVNDRLSPFP